MTLSAQWKSEYPQSDAPQLTDLYLVQTKVSRANSYFP
jgi:hypothetical protein